MRPVKDASSRATSVAFNDRALLLLDLLVARRGEESRSQTIRALVVEAAARAGIDASDAPIAD
jgi:hypothetical protein